MANLIFEKSDSLLSFESYQNADGFSALKKALKMKPEEIIKEITDSKLVGRGGAAFPVGRKMSFVANEDSDEKYIICNADEGEPGTFKDRELLKRNPMKIIESVIIAAYAIGATKGYLYVRGEYTNIKKIIQQGLEDTRKNGYLGDNILDSGFNFDIEYRSGIGAYICGEETALIESIEGRTGDPRHKPPFTAEVGLFGKPTLVHNVETLANLLPIFNLGSDLYKSYGTPNSTGSKLFSVSGNVVNKGVYEVAFGTSLKDLIYQHCGGVPNNLQIKFVQIGGSSGIVLPGFLLDIDLSYETFQKLGAGLGSGAIFVADQSVCVLDFLYSTARFFRHESCGKCTPCREGNRHISILLDNFRKGKGKPGDIETLIRTCTVMQEASFCGLGQSAPRPILSILKYFKSELMSHLKGKCLTGVCPMEEGGNHLEY
ncbi:MAG: SLBB domain-containing protein [Firmicutes bacterium]|jgi:NADH:ubiquinone oxidoreductase subunit F (NADH-binding)|nr:SLBB domain-containing protein [Bacillota bacterium]